MKKTPKITIAATAQLLGCSVRQVSTFAKEGLPHTKDRRGRLKFDPEQARQWRISHSHGGNILAAPPVTTGPTPTPSAVPAAINTAPGLPAAIVRLQEIELRAFTDYVKALKAGDVLAQRAAMRLHGESVKRLIEGFSETIRREQIKAEVWQEARQAIGDFHQNMRSLLDHMPRSLAQRCNPADPAMAEAVLSEWLQSQFYPTLSGRPATQEAQNV